MKLTPISARTRLNHILRLITRSGWLVLILLGMLPALGWSQTVLPWQLTQPQLQESLPILHADQVHRLGITGEGVGVAVVDIFTPNPDDPCRSAHGKWIEGLLKGVAPGAKVVRYDIGTVPTNTPRTCYIMRSSDINLALRAILADHHQQGIRVVNLSWGGGQYDQPCHSHRGETTKLIQALVRQGVTVVSAAGNNGFANALLWPACLPEVVSVGASFDYASDRVERTAFCSMVPVVDAVTCYSNTAPFLDVLAPGSRATLSSGVSGLGTSASTAYVSGVIALMLQAQSTLTPDEVRGTLARTGKQITDPRSGLNFPRADALAAVQTVRSSATPTHQQRLPEQPTLQTTFHPQGVTFTLPKNATQAQVTVYDLAGRLVFESGPQHTHTLSWSLRTQQGKRVPNGIYLVAVRAQGTFGAFHQLQKLAVLR